MTTPDDEITTTLNRILDSLPKPHDIIGRDNPEKYGHAFGWNDYRDEVVKLLKKELEKLK